MRYRSFLQLLKEARRTLNQNVRLNLYRQADRILVEEAARWTEAGRMLEVLGRHWDPAVPDEKADYRFTYEMRGEELTFVQESESGTTVWRFAKER